MPPQSEGSAEVEARTRELGEQLYLLHKSYRPGASERFQSALMSVLMEDPSLRTSLLRFVDVLAALPESGDAGRTAALFREYFRGDYSSLPVLERLALMVARSPLVPDLALAFLARRATRLTASRFIVPPRPDIVANAIQKLGEGNRNVSFDLLGEAVTSEEEARQYRQAYLDLIHQLSLRPQVQQRTLAA